MSKIAGLVANSADPAFYGIWSGFMLLAETCLSVCLPVNKVNIVIQPHILNLSYALYKVDKNQTIYISSLIRVMNICTALNK